MISAISSFIILFLAFLILIRCLSVWGVPGNVYVSKLFVSSSKPDNSQIIPELPIWKVFLGTLGFRVLVFFAGLVAVILFSDYEFSFEQAVQQLQKWDTQHYINLIEKGYTNYIEDGKHLFLVFFPAYVWAVRLLTLIIPNTIAAGVIFSCLCYAGGCCYIYRLASKCFNSQIAKDSLLYVSVFPFSFFSSMVMTEGLFLLATSAACYYAWRKKWILFGVFGYIAALTRMTGVIVIAFALVVLFEAEKPFASPIQQSIKRCWKTIAKRIPIILSPLLGTGTYLLLNYSVDGNPLAFVAHQEHWYQGYMWISDVISYLIEYFKDNIGFSTGWAIQFPALILFFSSVLLLFLSTRKKDVPPSLILYAFLYLFANYSLSWLLSAGRYLSCCFALFILLAKLTENRPTLRIYLLSTQAVSQGIFLCAYIAGAQVM